MLQVLCRNEIGDWSKWKEVFDSNREDRESAGLRLLQIWREAGSSGSVWYLLEATDQARAEEFLNGPKASMHADRAGASATECHFLETA